MAKKNKLKVVENNGNVDDLEPDFSDPEDTHFVENIPDSELLGDLLKQRPKESDVSEGIVIVDGVPEVGPERIEKLKGLMKKLFKDYGGGIIKDYYPVNENNVTKGYVFIELKDKASAEEAVKGRNNYKLDKAHTLSCHLCTDVDKYTNVPDRFEPPKPQPYQDLGNLHYYLLEENCFDQFSVITNGGLNTAIYLNSVPEPSLIEARDRWTETMVKWSPKGTYLATFHHKGIALWGRQDFKQIQKFNHPGVEFIDFSPCEKYIVTFSTLEQRSEDGKSIFIWDLRTGVKKRGYMAEKPSVWPVFKWSHDDKYFARASQDVISVYETPSFYLLDKKSMKVPGIKEFSWSPTDNIIVYWIAEHKDVPAKVSLMSIPGREELRSKNLFSVADAKMHWQKSGDYLCVKVARYAKAKREKNDWKYTGLYYSFEIFHMREKGIPVDSIEIKENILAFEWEPVDNKFAIISGEPPSINVSFFQVNKGQAPTELKKFEKRAFNSLFWSPRGQFVVLAGLRDMSGALEFIDTKDFTVMSSSEHFMATDIEWDPTGRYVASVVSWWGHKVDNAYWLWSFQGKCLRKAPMDKLCQLLWRPRPHTPLTAGDLREVKKNARKYNAMFEVQDKMRSSKASREIIEKRQTLMASFIEYRERMTKKYEFEQQELIKMRGKDPNCDSDETSEESDSFVVNRVTVAV